MMVVFLAFLGIVGGYLLTLIAPEELTVARKYAPAIQFFLFLIFVLIMAYEFRSSLFALSLLTLPALFWLGVLFRINLRIPSYRKSTSKTPQRLTNSTLLILKESVTYILCITPTLFSTSLPFTLTITSLLFLYGFPVAILVRKADTP